MIDILNEILTYITGLWTIPWILIGFISTIILSRIFDEKLIDRIMKKIGLILLYIFVPLLLFRIFLDVDFKESEILFSIICIFTLSSMYIFSYYISKYNVKKMKLNDLSKKKYIKTLTTNQGRSSAFVGSIMLAISSWQIPAAIYMSIGAIFLFAIIPYILSHSHKKTKKSKDYGLPWYLRIFPWYLLTFAFTSIIFHSNTGLYLKDFGDFGILFKFITAITIPAALYYVGAGIHPNDLKIHEIKNMFKIRYNKINHWMWIRNIIFINTLIIPIITTLFFGTLLYLNLIIKEWFAVLIINSVLPITSTNMFLIPYGIDKKVTALSVTWTTIICVPLVVLLITIFRNFLN